jgi:hypothetical protein
MAGRDSQMAGYPQRDGKSVGPAEPDDEPAEPDASRQSRMANQYTGKACQ